MDDNPTLTLACPTFWRRKYYIFDVCQLDFAHGLGE